MSSVSPLTLTETTCFSAPPAGLTVTVMFGWLLIVTGALHVGLAWRAHGAATVVGEIPAGLPSPALPDLNEFHRLVLPALGVLLVGYTDGISEAMNPQEEEWGEDAMLAELKNVYDKPSEEILTHIVACADKFADGAKQHDDMTMILMKVMMIAS